MSGTTTVSVGLVSFFTFMMFWTLNAEDGRDMNDVIVDYWEARIEVVAEQPEGK
jgi:hypothetical protein